MTHSAEVSAIKEQFNADPDRMAYRIYELERETERLRALSILAT